MNQIFRVIWNHATQSWVAVSELASAKGKTKSKTISKLAALSLVAGTALSMDAMAAYPKPVDASVTSTLNANGNLAILTNNRGSIDGKSATSSPKNVIYIGNGNLPGGIGDESVIIGNSVTGTATGYAADTLVGNRVRSGGGGQDSFGTAVGYAAQVSGPSVSIGVGTSSDIGSDRGWEAVKYSGVAIGAFSRVSGSANGGVAMGAISFADQTGSVAIGQLSGAASLLYDREVAGSGGGGKLYSTAEATGGNLVSIGAEAGARSTSSVAIGTQATTSKGDDSIAMGTNSAAIKNNSIAIGHAAIAGGHTQADIDALDAKKMLLEADKANADKRLQEKTDAAEANPTAENKFQLSAAKAAVERLDLAIRRIDADLQRLSSVTTRDATNAIAIGNQSKATDESALAFGNTALAKGVASIAQGKNTQATAENAIAVGTSSNVSGANSVALGANITKLTTANSVVLGANSTEVVGTTGASHAVQTVNDATVRTIAGPNFTYSGFVGKPADAGHYVSIGQKGSERQIKNLAAGAVDKNSTDAINGSQLYALMDRVENKQEPVVYTNKAGDKLVKVGDKFYKTTDLNDKGQPNNVNQNVPNDDVIASMNNAGNNTTTPMALANIAGNLLGAKNGSTAPTTSGTLPEGADAPNTSNAATVGDVLNAGWNLQNNGDAKDLVKPYDTVNFINGEGTTAVVETTDNKVSTVKFDVKLGTGLKKDDQGNVTVDTGDITNENGAPKVADADKGKVATVDTVAKAINDSYWIASAEKDGNTIGTDDNIKPSTKVTLDAGKNIEIDHSTPNKFTFKTVDKPEFTGVDLKDKDGNKVNLAPTADGLKLGKGDNNEPANITNVTSGLKPYAETTPDSPDAKKGLVDLSKPKDGSAPTVSDNTAATVGDLRNMGWVVSADKTTGNLGTPYSEAVKNANEVKFVGTGTATVSGKTDENGVRTITVDVNDQAVANNAAAPVVYTDENGDRVYPTGKKDEKGNLIFSKNPDGSGDPVTGPVKTSINGPEGTKSPTTLDNVAGNLPGAKKDTEAPTTTGVGPTEEDAKKIANNAATVGDVLNAGWNLQNNGDAKDFVKPYDTVNFINGEGTTAVVETKDNKVSTVKFDVKLGTGLKKDDAGNITVDAGDITNENGAPKVADADKGKVATVDTVAKAINDSYWIASAEKDGKTIGADDNVKPSTKVTFDAGKNIEIDHSTPNKFTFKTVDNPEFKTIDLNDGAGNKVNLAPTADGLKVGKGDNNDPVNITNVAGNLPGAKPGTDAPTTDSEGPTADELPKISNNAATVGDVLNSGWNLQNNGTAKDFVKPYDTVNFVDGEGTTAVVETTDNKVSTVKYNVNLGAGLEKGADNKINIKTDGDTITVGDDGLKVNTGSITVNNEDGKDADDNDVKAGTVSVPKADQNKVATVGDVANAINNAAWKATSGKDGSGVVTGTTTTPLVKAGNTVTYRAGNNLMLDQADKTFTYSLNPTLTGLTSAEFTDKDGNVNKIDANGMTMTTADKTKQPVSLTNNGLDNGNNRITNVAPGVKDTDAVNVSQLRNAVGNINKLQGQINKLGNRMNAGMATSAAMANLLQPHKPGQSVATAGVGQHKNQAAVAVGYSRISDNGKYGVRFSMGANTQGEVTSGAAVGYFW